MCAFYKEGLTRTKKKIKVWWITYYNLKQCRFIVIKYNDFAVVVVNNPRWRRQNRSSSLEKAWSWMVRFPNYMILGGSIIGDDYLWRAGKSLSRVAVRAISPSWEQCTCALWRTTESSAHVHCAQWSVENKGGQCTVDEQACPVHSGEQQCGQGNEALNKSHFVIFLTFM